MDASNPCPTLGSPPGFNPDGKDRNPGCKFPPKVQPGSFIVNLNGLNLPSESDTGAGNFTS